MALVLPGIVPSYVLRQESEAQLRDAVLSGLHTVIVGEQGYAQNCIGKTSILVSSLHKMLREEELREVCWIDFSQYRCEKVPFKGILCDVANRLLSSFRNILDAPSDPKTFACCSEKELQDYIRGLLNYLLLRGVSTSGFILALDGVTHQAEVSMFAFLGLQTIVTTRYNDAILQLFNEDTVKCRQVTLGIVEKPALREIVSRGYGADIVSDTKAFGLYAHIEPFSDCLLCCVMLSSVVSEEHNSMRSSSFTASLSRALEATSPGDEAQQVDIRQRSSREKLLVCLLVVLERLHAIDRTKFLVLNLLPCTKPIPLLLASRLWKASMDSVWVTLTNLQARGLAIISEDRASFRLPFEVANGVQLLSQGVGCTDRKFPYAADLMIEARLHAISCVLAYTTDPEVLSPPPSSGHGQDFWRGSPSFQAAAMQSLWSHLLQLDPDSFFEGRFGAPLFLDIYQEVLSDCDTGSTTSAGRTEEVLPLIVSVFASLDIDCFCGAGTSEDENRGSYRKTQEWIGAQIDGLLHVLYTVEQDNLEGRMRHLSFSVDMHELCWRLALALEKACPAQSKACCEYALGGLSAEVEGITKQRFQMLRMAEAFLLLGRVCLALHEEGEPLEQSAHGDDSISRLEEGLLAVESGIDCLQDAIAAQEQDPVLKVHPALQEAWKIKVALLQAAERHEEAFGVVRAAVAACEDVCSVEEGDTEQKEQRQSPTAKIPGAKECMARQCVLLGDVLMAWGGKKRKARKAYEEALLALQQVLPEVDPILADVCHSLGTCCYSLRLFDNAEAMFRRSLAVDQLLFGLEHPRISVSLRSLIEVLKLKEQNNQTPPPGDNADLTITPARGKETKSSLKVFLRKVLKALLARDHESSGKGIYSGDNLTPASNPEPAFQEAAWGFHATGDSRDTVIDILLVMSDMCASERGKLKESKGLLKKALEAALRQREAVHLGSPTVYRDAVSTHQHGQLKRIFSHMGDLYCKSGSTSKASSNYIAALLHTLCADGVLLPGRGGSSVRLRDFKALVGKLRGTYQQASRRGDALVLCDGLLSLLGHTHAAYCEKILGRADDLAVRERRKAVFGTVPDSEKLLPQTLASLSRLGLLFAEWGDDESARLVSAFLKKRQRLGEAGLAVAEQGEKLPSVLVQSDASTAATEGCYTPGSAFKHGTIVIGTIAGSARTSRSKDEITTAASLLAQQENNEDKENALRDDSFHETGEGNMDDGQVQVEVVGRFAGEQTARFLQTVHAGLIDAVREQLSEADKSRDSRKALLRCRNDAGNTPLSIAVASQNEELFFLLLKHHGRDADVDTANDDGDTPLLLAVLGRNAVMTKALVKRGANPRHRNKEGITALEVAAWNEDKAVFNLLSAEHPHVVRIQAIVRGRQAFLKWNATIKKRYHTLVNSRLLRKACLEGNHKVIPELLATGACVNAGDPPHEGGDGSTPLLLATMAGYVDIVNLLLSAYDADVTVASMDGLHPLLAACATGRANITRSILASRSFDPRALNKADEAGTTPLLACIHANHDDAAGVLLTHPQYGHHVDCNVADAHGNTALHLAVRGGRTELFDHLTRVLDRPRGRAMNNPHRNATNVFGDSPLLLACLRADRHMVEVLLGQGGDKAQCNADGLSPHAYVDSEGPAWLEHLLNMDTKAAVAIQACYRMHCAYHGWVGRAARAKAQQALLDKEAQRNFLKVARVQALVRGVLGRRRYKDLRYAAVEDRVREYALMRLAPCLIRFAKKTQRKNKQKHNLCALLIQQCWKSRVVRKRRAREAVRRMSSRPTVPVTIPAEPTGALVEVCEEAYAAHGMHLPPPDLPTTTEVVETAQAVVVEDEESQEEEGDDDSPAAAIQRAKARRRQSLDSMAPEHRHLVSQSSSNSAAKALGMRKAVANTRQSVLLAEMLKSIPAQEIWEVKALKKANRRRTVAALTAEMPQQEEWEKKAISRRASMATTGGGSVTPPPACPPAATVATVETEVEEAEKAQDAPMPTPEPDAPLSAQQLKMRRMKAAISAVVAINRTSAGSVRVTSPSRDTKTSRTLKLNTNKIYDLVESNADPLLIVELLRKDPSQAAFTSAAGEPVLHLALRTMDPSARGMYQQMHDCILELVNYHPVAARSQNHIGNTPAHLLLTRLAAFTPTAGARRQSFIEGSPANAGQMDSHSKLNHVIETLDALLAEYPACVREKNRQGDLPLHVAVRNTALEPNPERLAQGLPSAAEELIVRLLEANTDAVRQCNGASEYPLHLVLNRYCSAALAQRILNLHPKALFEKGQGGRFPLRIAYVNQCSAAVIQALLYAGGGDAALISSRAYNFDAPTNGTGPRRGTADGSALHMALKYRGSAAACAVTLRHDSAQCEVRDEDGYLALHVALKALAAPTAASGACGVTPGLLESILKSFPAGAAEKMNGMLPLHYAVRKRLDCQTLSLLSEWHPYDDAIKREAEKVIVELSSRRAQEEEAKESAENDVRADLLNKERTASLAREREKRQQHDVESLQAKLAVLREESEAAMAQPPRPDFLKKASSTPPSFTFEVASGRKESRNAMATFLQRQARAREGRALAEERRRGEEREAALAKEEERVNADQAAIEKLRAMEEEIASKQQLYRRALERVSRDRGAGDPIALVEREVEAAEGVEEREKEDAGAIFRPSPAVSASPRRMVRTSTATGTGPPSPSTAAKSGVKPRWASRRIPDTVQGSAIKTSADLFMQDSTARYRFNTTDEEGEADKGTIKDSDTEKVSRGESSLKTPFGTRSSLMYHSSGLVGAETATPVHRGRKPSTHHSGLSHFDDDDESDGLESD